MKSNPVVLTTFMSAGITLFLNGDLDNETVINDYITVTSILDNLPRNQLQGPNLPRKPLIRI